MNDEEDSYLQDDGQTTKARVVNRSILKYLDLDGLKHLMNLFTAFVSNYAAPKSHNHDATYAKTSHSHTIAQVNNLQETLNGKAPSSHTHTIGGVTNLQTELDKKSDKTHNHDSVYSKISHSHSTDNLTSGTLPIGRGGTGSTNSVGAASTMLNALEQGTAAPRDDDWYVAKYAENGNNTPVRRTHSALWSYIKAKTDPLYATRTHNHDASYAAKSHNHSADNITSGVLPIGRGGTGSGNRAGALYNIVTGENVSSSTDWNSITRGYHMVGQGTAFTADKHAPVGMYTYGYMLSMDNFQIYVAHNGGIAHRQFWNNTWTNWITSFDGKSVIPIVNGGTGAQSARAAEYNIMSQTRLVDSVVTDNDYFVGLSTAPNTTNGATYKRTAANVWNYIKSKTSALYLPLTGGTMSGQIKHPGSGCSWVVGRNSAVLRTTTSNSTDYKPIISGKTYQGSWDLGTYVNENLHFSYITDANYNAGTNKQTANIIFSPDSSITASTFKGNLYGNASTANLATAVKDRGDGRTLYLNYSAAGMTSADYFATWEGSTLKSMHKNTVRGVIGAAAASHNHGTVTDNFTVNVENTTTDSGWSMIGGNNGHLLKSIRTQTNAPSWLLNNFSAGIAFGGADTKGVMSVSYDRPNVKFAGGNGTKPIWNFNVSGTTGKAYNLDNMSVNGHSHAWSSITGKPSTFAPSSHNHSAANITSGTLPVSRGGTGATGKGTTLLSNLGITMGTAAAPATGTAGTIYIQLLSAAKSVDEPVTIPELGDDVEYDTGTDIPPISDHNSDGSDSSPEYAPDETVDILEPEQNTQIDKEPSAPEYIDGPEADKINSDGGDV